MNKLRLIVDGPRSATLNMAIDEMLALSQVETTARPTLRFYGWSRASITAGYFQKIEEVAKKFKADEKGIPVVRRLSGGGAVLHEKDLTFSLSLPLPNPFFPAEVKTSYLKINEAVRGGLKDRYPALDYADCRTVPSGKNQAKERTCFEQPACYDLLLSGKKILGSSQRRIGKCFLHQATLFLGQDNDALLRDILRGFERQWKVSFEERGLAPEELRRAKRVEEERYASPEWALFRDLSFLS